jgi:hypothetical protein
MWCQCPKDGPQPVTVQIDGEPYEAEYVVSVTCARCEKPWRMERTAEVSSTEIPMTIVRSIGDDEGDDLICYQLTARTEDVA